MTTETSNLERISYRPREAAAVVGLSDDVIGRAIRDGSLKSLKVGGARLIEREALQAWIASHAE